MKLHNPFRTALVATLGVGVGILLITSVQSLSTVLLYVGTALFLSLGLDPIVSWLERRRFPRWLAVLTAIMGVLGVFASIILIVVPVIIEQINQLVSQINTFLYRLSSENYYNDFLATMKEQFPNLDIEVVLTQVQNWAFRSLGTLPETILNITMSTFTGLMGALIVLILTIYFTASTPSLKAAVYQLAPASRRARFIDLADQITDSVGYYVIGQVTLGAINGVLSVIFLSIINAPFPAVLAVIAFFFSLIPLVGTLTGSTVIVLVCLLPSVGSPTIALTAAIWYFIYMQVEAYFVSPRIMSRAVSVPGAVVVIAALSGGALLGLLGALIAIPVAASILIIYRQVIIPRQNER